MGDVLIEVCDWVIKNWLASAAIIVALWGCVFGVVHKYFTSTNKIVVIKSVLTTTFYQSKTENLSNSACICKICGKTGVLLSFMIL